MTESKEQAKPIAYARPDDASFLSEGGYRKSLVMNFTSEFYTVPLYASLPDTALDEREACAKLAEKTTAFDDDIQRGAGCLTSGQRIAAAIRARAEPKQ